MTEGNENDHKIWRRARNALRGHFAGDGAGGLKEITLDGLPRLCCWPSGLPLTFDQFRRRFECSRERALLWNRFVEEDGKAAAQSQAQSNKDRKPRPAKTDAYVRVLCELLWLVYSVVNKSDGSTVHDPKRAIYLDDKVDDPNLANGETCSNCRKSCIKLGVDTAFFVSKDLRVNAQYKQVFEKTSPKCAGWSALRKDDFEQNFDIDNDYPTALNGKLIPLDAYRVFYEDGRAQMVYSIGHVGDAPDPGVLAINGFDNSCGAHTRCHQISPDSCNGLILDVLKCPLMPQVDPEKVDAFRKYVDDAVGPVLKKQTSVAKAFTERVESKDSISKDCIRSVGVCVAVPMAEIHSNSEGNVEGTFAFLNLMLHLPKDVREDVVYFDGTDHNHST